MGARLSTEDARFVDRLLSFGEGDKGSDAAAAGHGGQPSHEVLSEGLAHAQRPNGTAGRATAGGGGGFGYLFGRGGGGGQTTATAAAAAPPSTDEATCVPLFLQCDGPIPAALARRIMGVAAGATNEGVSGSAETSSSADAAEARRLRLRLARGEAVRGLFQYTSVLIDQCTCNAGVAPSVPAPAALALTRAVVKVIIAETAAQHRREQQQQQKHQQNATALLCVKAKEARPHSQVPLHVKPLHTALREAFWLSAGGPSLSGGTNENSVNNNTDKGSGAAELSSSPVVPRLIVALCDFAIRCPITPQTAQTHIEALKLLLTFCSTALYDEIDGDGNGGDSAALKLRRQMCAAAAAAAGGGDPNNNGAITTVSDEEDDDGAALFALQEEERRAYSEDRGADGEGDGDSDSQRRGRSKSGEPAASRGGRPRRGGRGLRRGNAPRTASDYDEDSAEERLLANDPFYSDSDVSPRNARSASPTRSPTAGGGGAAGAAVAAITPTAADLFVGILLGAETAAGVVLELLRRASLFRVIISSNSAISAAAAAASGGGGGGAGAANTAAGGAAVLVGAAGAGTDVILTGLQPLSSDEDAVRAAFGAPSLNSAATTVDSLANSINYYHKAYEQQQHTSMKSPQGQQANGQSQAHCSSEQCPRRTEALATLQRVAEAAGSEAPEAVARQKKAAEESAAAKAKAKAKQSGGAPSSQTAPQAQPTASAPSSGSTPSPSSGWFGGWFGGTPASPSPSPKEDKTDKAAEAAEVAPPKNEASDQQQQSAPSAAKEAETAPDESAGATGEDAAKEPAAAAVADPTQPAAATAKAAATPCCECTCGLDGAADASVSTASVPAPAAATIAAHQEEAEAEEEPVGACRPYSARSALYDLSLQLLCVLLFHRRGYDAAIGFAVGVGADGGGIAAADGGHSSNSAAGVPSAFGGGHVSRSPSYSYAQSPSPSHAAAGAVFSTTTVAAPPTTREEAHAESARYAHATTHHFRSNTARDILKSLVNTRAPTTANSAAPSTTAAAALASAAASPFASGAGDEDPSDPMSRHYLQLMQHANPLATSFAQLAASLSAAMAEHPLALSVLYALLLDNKTFLKIMLTKYSDAAETMVIAVLQALVQSSDCLVERQAKAKGVASSTTAADTQQQQQPKAAAASWFGWLGGGGPSAAGKGGVGGSANDGPLNGTTAHAQQALLLAAGVASATPKYRHSGQGSAVGLGGGGDGASVIEAFNSATAPSVSCTFHLAATVVMILSQDMCVGNALFGPWRLAGQKISSAATLSLLASASASGVSPLPPAARKVWAWLANGSVSTCGTLWIAALCRCLLRGFTLHHYEATGLLVAALQNVGPFIHSLDTAAAQRLTRVLSAAIRRLPREACEVARLEALLIDMRARRAARRRAMMVGVRAEGGGGASFLQQQQKEAAGAFDGSPTPDASLGEGGGGGNATTNATATIAEPNPKNPSDASTTTAATALGCDRCCIHRKNAAAAAAASAAFAVASVAAIRRERREERAVAAAFIDRRQLLQRLVAVVTGLADCIGGAISVTDKKNYALFYELLYHKPQLELEGCEPSSGDGVTHAAPTTIGSAAASFASMTKEQRAEAGTNYLRRYRPHLAVPAEPLALLGACGTLSDVLFLEGAAGLTIAVGGACGGGVVDESAAATGRGIAGTSVSFLHRSLADPANATAAPGVGNGVVSAVTPADTDGGFVVVPSTVSPTTAFIGGSAPDSAFAAVAEALRPVRAIAAMVDAELASVSVNHTPEAILGLIRSVVASHAVLLEKSRREQQQQHSQQQYASLGGGNTSFGGASSALPSPAAAVGGGGAAMSNYETQSVGGASTTTGGGGGVSTMAANCLDLVFAYRESPASAAFFGPMVWASVVSSGRVGSGHWHRDPASLPLLSPAKAAYVRRVANLSTLQQ